MIAVRTLGVVGSRGYGNAEGVRKRVLVSGLYDTNVTRVMVSGAEPKGVDAAARRAFADQWPIEKFIDYPPKRELGRRMSKAEMTAAFVERDWEIARHIEREKGGLVAIPCPHSKGTWITVRAVATLGRPVVVLPTLKCNCEE